MKDSRFKQFLLKLYWFQFNLRLRAIERFSYFFYKKSRQYKEDKRTLSALSNKYAGHRAFILGNGPSLKAEDLDKLMANGEITFASNGIYRIFSQTRWRPTYFMYIDHIIGHGLMDMVWKAEADYKFLAIKGFLKTRKAPGRKVFLNVDGDRIYLKKPCFSSDASKTIYAIATTTYSLIELAVFMGFRELYIIGCDHQYSLTLTRDGQVIDNKVENHFSKEYENSQKIVAESTWEMDIAYEYARKYADEHGIKIYNATRGGKLEAFERVDFDSLFNKNEKKDEE